jgi:splicing factor U2AF subunit
VKLLNAALSALKANTQPGDPVLSAWISTDGHYAFVEFRSAEEANNGFQLNNIMILGQPLKVGRPKTYTGALSMMEDGILCNTVAAALQAGTMNAPVEGKKIQFPSRILCFKGAVYNINIDNDEEYNEVSEDFKVECSKYGRVVSVFMPRKDVDDIPSPGMGNVFIEFQTLEEAKEVRKVNY